MTQLLGYARVSTADQAPELQLDELAAAGCARIWTDHATGTRADRPELAKVLDDMRAGDTLVVWRFDRLARSLSDLIAIAAQLEHCGVGLRSLREQIDTATAGGHLVFHVFGGLAEFEADLIRERMTAGPGRSRTRATGRPQTGHDRREDERGAADARRPRAHRRGDRSDSRCQSRECLPRARESRSPISRLRTG